MSFLISFSTCFEVFYWSLLNSLLNIYTNLALTSLPVKRDVNLIDTFALFFVR